MKNIRKYQRFGYPVNKKDFDLWRTTYISVEDDNTTRLATPILHIDFTEILSHSDLEELHKYYYRDV